MLLGQLSDIVVMQFLCVCVFILAGFLAIPTTVVLGWEDFIH